LNKVRLKVILYASGLKVCYNCFNCICSNTSSWSREIWPHFLLILMKHNLFIFSGRGKIHKSMTPDSKQALFYLYLISHFDTFFIFLRDS